MITNAFNLVDGLDGLAGGLVAIAGGHVRGGPDRARRGRGRRMLVALVGATVGFLAYNLHPARIFLGDSGSLLAGFLLAVTAITGQQKGATTLAAGVPLLIFALPLAETVTTVLRRLVAGQRGALPGLSGRTRALGTSSRPTAATSTIASPRRTAASRQRVRALSARVRLVGRGALTMQVP